MDKSKYIFKNHTELAEDAFNSLTDQIWKQIEQNISHLFLDSDQKTREIFFHVNTVERTKSFILQIEGNMLELHGFDPVQLTIREWLDLLEYIRNLEKKDTAKLIARKLRHDIATPLTAISMNIDFVEREFEDLPIVDFETKSMISSAFTGARNSLDLTYKSIDNIKTRDIDYLESDIISKFMEGDTCCGESLKKLYQLLVTLIISQNEGIPLIAFTVPQCRSMKINYTSLLRVFKYVIINAMDTVEKPTIFVNSKEADDRLHFDWHNNGPGIDPAEKRNIFKSINSVKEGNLGLELPMCSQILEYFDSDIDVIESRNKCIISVQIPLIKK